MAKILIDDLSYFYAPQSNTLMKVEDVVYDVGFENGNSETDDYAYDLNGNLVMDKNKQIAEIKYNHLNLPIHIRHDEFCEGHLNFTYSATGAKLEKEFVIDCNPFVQVKTQYAGNYIYEKVWDPDGQAYSTKLKMFFQPEGYVEPVDPEDYSQGFRYVYQYKDIWRNVRLSYSDSNNNGSIDPATEILDERNYYPFGLEHQGYNGSLIGTENNFKTYQSQELTKDLGLNIHEWKYRISDPAIGRFWQIDPLAEDYYYNSTHAFQENKIGMGIELEGLEVSTDKEKNQRVLLNTVSNFIENPDRKSTGKPVFRIGLGISTKSTESNDAKVSGAAAYAELQITSEGEKIEAGFSLGNFESKSTENKLSLLDGKINKNTRTGETESELNIMNDKSSSSNNNNDIEATIQGGGGYISTNISELGRALNDIGILIKSFFQAKVEEYTGGSTKFRF